MFFRLSDIISLSSILKGEWEEETNSVIRYYSKKGFSNYPFLIFEKKKQKSKFESPYENRVRIAMIAMNGTEHTVKTEANRIIP